MASAASRSAATTAAFFSLNFSKTADRQATAYGANSFLSPNANPASV